MSIAPGERLGHFDILAAIGKGGMGDVYKAHDSRLRRDVAIKVSREQFTERFAREARVVASLNHPNICTVFDVGPNYLVMELIDGDTLADRLRQGPIPLEEALRIAGQIAEALREAHEKGVTHRDLKPGNIKIRPDGTVKVLDFGLAKVGGIPGVSADDSPTLTLDATLAGAILGTAAYMSPEQARGKPVDKRADIWAFGVVLYEMVTGQRLFAGDSLADTVASVIEREPDLGAVPVRLRRLLGACLQKDPQHRLQDISDAMLLLEPVVPVTSGVVGAPRRRAPLWIGAAVAAAVMIPLSVAGVRHFRETPPVARQVRFTLATPPLASGQQFYLALSPDNTSLAFTATTADGVPHIFVRDMATLDARLLPGTEGAVGLFWSPDSRYLGFGQQNTLKKIDVAASTAPGTVAELTATVGTGAWNADGVIVFGLRAPGQRVAIHRVAASGGTATDLTLLRDDEVIHSCPAFLPDGRHFLYLRVPKNDAERQGLYVGSIDAKPADQPDTRVLDTSRGAIVVPAIDGSRSVRVLFVRDGALMTQSFEVAQLQLVGDPVVVEDHVGAAPLCGSFAATAGLLAYRAAEGGVRLTWYDRNGTVVGGLRTEQTPIAIALSADDTHLALSGGAGDADEWVVDLTSGASTRVTSGPTPDLAPVLSPDGDTIVYADYKNDMYRKSSDGLGEAQLLLKNAIPQDWSADGKYLLYTTTRGNQTDVWVLPMDGSGRNAAAVAATQFPEGQARFSRDARWVAYVSKESTRAEVYVQRFVPPGEGPAATRRVMVSNGGGSQPRWSRDSEEIFYLSGDGQLTSVAVKSQGDSVVPAPPKALFPVPPLLGGMPNIESATVASGMPRWDISHDGSRFLFITTNTDSNSAPITILENWQALLQK